MTEKHIEIFLTKLKERDAEAINILTHMVNLTLELAEARSKGESPDEDLDYWDYRADVDTCFDDLAENLEKILK